MTTINVHSGDTVVIAVSVADQSLSPPVKDITGATITAWAADLHGNTVDGDVLITDAPNGEFTVAFDADEIVTGQWTFQARVILGLESQIVTECKIIAAPSWG